MSLERYDVIIEKYNHNHDARGRFSSSSSAGAAIDELVEVDNSPKTLHRVYANGGGGTYTAGGSAFSPGGIYEKEQWEVPPSDKSKLTVNIAPRANGFSNGKYVMGNMSAAILQDGNVVVQDGIDVRERVAFMVENEIARLGGEIQDGVFYRGTNNKNEINLLRSGKLKNSKNHATGEEENGVSVWDKMTYASHAYTYKVTGDVVGIGADGEPVLNPKSMKVVGKMKPTTEYNAEAARAREKGKAEFLKRYNWTPEQVEQAVKGGYTKEPLSDRAIRA